MAKPFDSTLNVLIDDHVPEWVAYLTARAGLPSGPAESIDTDLSSTLQADRLFRIEANDPYLLHLELESSGRLGIPAELLRYNVAAFGATGLPVASVAMLLRPKANATDLNGELELRLHGRTYLMFRYAVIRLWTETVDDLLNAGLGLAPLSLLTNEAAGNLDAAFEKFCERLQSPEVPMHIAKSLFGSTFVLSGLRYNSEAIANLYRRLSMTLEDSTTYQMILSRGKELGEVQGRSIGEKSGAANEARQIIRRLGTKRFGPISEFAESFLTSIGEVDQLERLADRLLDAKNWEELLAE